jgi:hypothetical protein
MWTIEQFSGNVDPATKDMQNNDGVGNWLSPEQYPSRLAREALRDYINKFKALTWMPGGFYNGSWQGDEYQRLYRKNGWPENFDSVAFNHDRVQWLIDDELRRTAEEPFERVTRLVIEIESLLGSISRKQKEIADIDAGLEPSQPWPDLPRHRADLVEGSTEASKQLLLTQAQLEEAREALKTVDPAVRKAREARIAKYGF